MENLTSHAAWTLIITFSLSIVYEIYRATLKKGVSKHDSMKAFFALSPLYLVSALIISFLFVGYSWAALVGLIYCAILIMVSIFYYNPKIMLERKPGIFDWFEDLIYTGLLFTAATMLAYEVFT